MAKELIQHINGTIVFSSDSRGNVLVCTPLGELHNLGCDIIESVLVSRGYRVFNASPSIHPAGHDRKVRK